MHFLRASLSLAGLLPFLAISCGQQAQGPDGSLGDAAPAKGSPGPAAATAQAPPGNETPLPAARPDPALTQDLQALTVEVAALRKSVEGLQRAVSELKTAFCYARQSSGAGDDSKQFLFAMLPLSEKIERCRRCVNWKLEKNQYALYQISRGMEATPEGIAQINELIAIDKKALYALDSVKHDFELRDWCEEAGSDYVYLDKEIAAWKDQ